MWQLSNLQIDSSVIQIVQSDVLRNSVDTTAAITNNFCSDTLATRLPSLSCFASRRFCFSREHFFPPSEHICSSTARIEMHHPRPPARKPTHTSSVEDESGSRASPTVLMWFRFLRTEAHTDNDKPPASEKPVPWFLHRQLVDFFSSELISARLWWIKSSSCYIFSRKRLSLTPSCLIVPRCFCLKVEFRHPVKFCSILITNQSSIAFLFLLDRPRA